MRLQKNNVTKKVSKEINFLLIEFFKKSRIEYSIQEHRFMVGKSFQFYIAPQKENRIKISVEVWKEGNPIDGLEIMEIINNANLKVLEYSGFDDCFFESISLSSILDISALNYPTEKVDDINQWIIQALRTRIIMVLNDVIRLERYLDYDVTNFHIDTYFSGKSISAYELIDALQSASIEGDNYQKTRQPNNNCCLEKLRME